MNPDITYKKYVEHWGDPIDPINYKLYGAETAMPYFHSNNRLFTKDEFNELIETNDTFKQLSLCWIVE